MANKPTVRAVFDAKPAENARQPDTPLSSAWSLVVRHKGEMREAVCVRSYYNPKGSGMQPVRACIWIRPADSGAEWRSGKGSASGCGYHKESAAVADAVSSAGVRLFGSAYSYRSEPVDMKKPLHFGGTGDSAYQAIFEAIARAAGYRISKGSSILLRH